LTAADSYIILVEAILLRKEVTMAIATRDVNDPEQGSGIDAASSSTDIEIMERALELSQRTSWERLRLGLHLIRELRDEGYLDDEQAETLLMHFASSAIEEEASNVLLRVLQAEAPTHGGTAFKRLVGQLSARHPHRAGV
jgi:DNA-directed RNA polymerase specialized sigma54-like protein